MKKIEIFKNGLFKENPIFAMFLGMCSALAVTTTLNNAVGMGLAVIFVLVMSNAIISILRKIIPDEIRIPAYIVIIATLVKIVEMVVHAYMPALYDSLGIFLPLIVVNCVILGRAESFANKNGVVSSIIDGIGMGLGYTFALVVISFFRQLLGTGILSFANPFDANQVWFNLEIAKDFAINIFTQPAGAFLTLGLIVGIINTLNIRKAKKAAAKKVEVK